MPTPTQPTSRQHGARVREERSRWSPRVSGLVSVSVHAALFLTVVGASVRATRDAGAEPPTAVERLVQVISPPLLRVPRDVAADGGADAGAGTDDSPAGDDDVAGEASGEAAGASAADAPASDALVTQPQAADQTLAASSRDLASAETWDARPPLDAPERDDARPTSSRKPRGAHARSAPVDRSRPRGDVSWSEYAHAEEAGARDEAARRIGAVDAATPTEHREAVSADAPGRPSPQLSEAPIRSHRPGAPTPRVAPATRLGDTPSVDATAGGAPRPTRAATPHTPAPHTAPAAPERLAHAPSTPSRPSPTPSPSTTPGLHAPAGRDATWAPTAFRVPSAGRAGQASPAAPARAPTQARRVTTETTAATKAPLDMARIATAPVEPSPALAADATTAPSPDAEPAPSLTQSIRAALGWGTQDAEQTRAPLAQEGSLGGESAAQGSTRAVLPEEVATDGPAAASTRATPLGRYDAVIEGMVSERWFALSLPPSDAALGVSGKVILRFHVDRSGRVSGLHVESASGFAVLDALALSSVPARFPHFPADLDLAGLEQRLVMRWRQAPLAEVSP